jgi:hypothetical protein
VYLRYLKKIISKLQKKKQVDKKKVIFQIEFKNKNKKKVYQ